MKLKRKQQKNNMTDIKFYTVVFIVFLFMVKIITM